MTKELLFSVTKKDLRIETFRCGGAGGQHRDKTSNGVRITHLESGAVSECTQFREQSTNKKTALQRLTKKAAFIEWYTSKAAEMRIDKREVERMVDEQMLAKNLLIEEAPFDE